MYRNGVFRKKVLDFSPVGVQRLTSSGILYASLLGEKFDVFELKWQWGLSSNPQQ